ncbi:MAG: response regulator transcription factor [Myxococcales bacterium]|nr:response regulator transcription factor [Myxococcales bacterium]
MQSFYRDLSYPYSLENALRLAGALGLEDKQTSDENIAEPKNNPQTKIAAHSEKDPKGPQGHIFVYDDDSQIRELLKEVLQRNGYQVTCYDALQGDELDFAVLSQQADALLLDRHLGKDDGLEFLQRVREEGINLPTILMSGQDLTNKEQARLTLLQGDFFAKPFKVKELLSFLHDSLHLGQPASL